MINRPCSFPSALRPLVARVLWSTSATAPEVFKKGIAQRKALGLSEILVFCGSKNLGKPLGKLMIFWWPKDLVIPDKAIGVWLQKKKTVNNVSRRKKKQTNPTKMKGNNNAPKNHPAKPPSHIGYFVQQNSSFSLEQLSTRHDESHEDQKHQEDQTFSTDRRFSFFFSKRCWPGGTRYPFDPLAGQGRVKS